MEDRVHALESTSPNSTKRLSKLEEIVRPHDKKIQDVANELDGLKKKHEAFKTGALKEWEKKFQLFADGITKRSDDLAQKVDDIRLVDLALIEEKTESLTAEIKQTSNESTKNVNELATDLTKRAEGLTKRVDNLPFIRDQANINSSVQTLLARVSKLESQSKVQTLQEPLSTNAMADALILRLTQGDFLETTTLARLREVLPMAAGSSIDQQAVHPPTAASYQTPESAPSVSKAVVLEKQSAPAQRKRTIAQTHADNDGAETARQDAHRPRKRVRAQAHLARTTARKSLRSVLPPQAIEHPNEEATSFGAQENVDTTAEDVREETEETPEIRRSARTPKPNKKHASFLTWIEVRDRRKTR